MSLASVAQEKNTNIAVDQFKILINNPRIINIAALNNKSFLFSIILVKLPFWILSKLNSFHKGEILINFTNLENTYLGPDISGLKFMMSKINKKIIYNCGISSINDIKTLSKFTNINAVCVGSLFIFSKKNKGVLINYDNKI